MKQKTLLLFQLLLAVFAFYAVVKYRGNMRLIAPLFCLIGMFVVSKVETILTDKEEVKETKEKETVRKDEEKEQFKPLDCLLKSNNVLLLTDAVHHLLKGLDLLVSRSPDQAGIDRLVKAPDGQATIGLKIVGDVGEPNENWEKWEELSEFDLGKGGKRRLLLIGSNPMQEEGGAQPKFRDFPAATQKLLSAKHIVAMTTLTFYKICLLCQKKKVDPKLILDLIQRHPGGVFRLEQYTRGSSKAA
jgi:hypothetical protein